MYTKEDNMKTKTTLNSIRLLMSSGKVVTLEFNSKRTTQRANKICYDYLGARVKHNFNTKRGLVTVVFSEVHAIQQVI